MAEFSESLQQMPANIQAEQSLLGSILLDPNSINEVASVLHAEDFYLSSHQDIYRAIQSLFQENKPIDISLLTEKMKELGAIESKEEAERYLRPLVEHVPSSRNISDYCQIIRDKSLLRSLIRASEQISEKAHDEHEPAKEIVDYAEKLVYDISRDRGSQNFRDLQEIINSVYAELHNMYESDEDVQGAQTGFSHLDQVLAGINETDFVVVGARPGVGKTSFVLNIATNYAKARKGAVAIFSLEMSAEQLVSRILSSEAMVDSVAMRTGKLTENDWNSLAQASEDLYGCRILIDDTAGQTVTSMKAKLRRIREPLGMVIIDYLQLMHGETRTESRVQEVSEISRGLKLMAKEMKIPVICCAQLSRAPESGSGSSSRAPMLSDLRDSGAIEQDADTVIFLYRPKADNKKEEQENNIVKVSVAKNRHGETRTIELGWAGRYTKFRTLSNTDLQNLVPPEP